MPEVDAGHTDGEQFVEGRSRVGLVRSGLGHEWMLEAWVCECRVHHVLQGEWFAGRGSGAAHKTVSESIALDITNTTYRFFTKDIYQSIRFPDNRATTMN